MQDQLKFSIRHEALDEGSPEEKAAFGMLKIAVYGNPLAMGRDAHTNRFRNGPLVSGYHLAKWLVWNWWRLRWELRPESPCPDWSLAHCMASIGEGYVWPNVTIFSDGFRTALVSKPSRDPDATPFRYVGAQPFVVSAEVFESAVDVFVRRVVENIRKTPLTETNLQILWRRLAAERENPERLRFRRVEALFGYDPDDADAREVVRYLDDAKQLGEDALVEVAADTAEREKENTHLNTMGADYFMDMAQQQGFDARVGDTVTLDAVAGIPTWGETAAWRVGEAVARVIRRQERLGAEPICNSRLAELAGTSPDAIADQSRRSDAISFVLGQGNGAARVALRSKWETGRRFDLARLVGDRLFANGDQLLPATRAYSYRQKMQRAFATELLSPFTAVDDMLNGDYSEEMQLEAAERFNVSPMTVQSLLTNKERIAGDSALDDFDFGVAA